MRNSFTLEIILINIMLTYNFVSEQLSSSYCQSVFIFVPYITIYIHRRWYEVFIAVNFTFILYIFNLYGP